MFSLSSRWQLASVFVFGLAAFGCAAPADGDASEEVGTESDELRWPFGGGGGGFSFGGGGQGQAVVSKDGLFSTLVRANGSGCPKGTWNAGISPDGQTFTITFSAYEARVSPGQANESKDCAIDVALVGTAKLKFNVGSLYYQGYVLLESPGMRAVQSADYTFHAAGLLSSLLDVNVPLPNEAHSESAVGGPINESYVNTDNVGGSRWSPCNKANNLHIRTRLRLENDGARSGSGYVNNSTVDGTLSFAWKMNWEKC